MLGRYAIGESRGFYTHHGFLNESRAVKVLECPPLRPEESQSKYYADLEEALHGLAGPVHHVVVLVKYSPIGFGGFRLDRQKNIPEFELVNLKKTLGYGFTNILTLVVSNWSRQFARIADRRQKGITENVVADKLQEEMANSLSSTTFPIYFLDTVFWRTEQKSGMVPNTLPTTLETMDSMIMSFVNQPDISQPKSTGEVNVDSSDKGSSDSNMEDTIKLGQRWRNKKYQDLSEDDYKPKLQKSSLTIPKNSRFVENRKSSSKDTNYCSHNTSALSIQRAVPVHVRSRSVSSSSEESSSRAKWKEPQTEDGRMELGEYVEAKVREMIDKEGVTFDFSDSKLTGKIVTKTTIIKEVRERDGSSQFIEDEVIDEKHFGSELDSISGRSLSQYEEDSKTEPMFSVGPPVLSSTFNRHGNDSTPVTKEFRYHESKSIPLAHTSAQRPRVTKSSSSSSTSISSDCETIEVIEKPDTFSPRENIDLKSIDSVVVILGTEPNITQIRDFLKQRNVSKVVCAPVSTTNNSRAPYKELAQKIKCNEKVIFIWAVETKTGQFLDDMVHMFADFIEAFSPEAIESMIVVLWHPGSTDDIKSSVEDLTRKFEQCIEYHSSIGFTVLHYKPIQRFYETLAEKTLSIKPMAFKLGFSVEALETTSNSTLSDTENIIGGPDETVDSPVILMVSPPGHGKSSVGNLLLGAGNFPVRGISIGENQTLQVKTGWLYHEEFRVTCIESPGLYEDGIDEKDVEEMEKYLRDIGFLTHLIIVWDALEWRTEDLDFILTSVKHILGDSIIQHVLFAITFWDHDQKSKKERKKRKLTANSLTSMVRAKVDHFFSQRFEPKIFFVSARSPNDKSRADLANFLSGTGFETFSTTEMKPWMRELKGAMIVGGQEDTTNEYEDVGRSSVSHSTIGYSSKSKSMYNLDQDQNQKNMETNTGGGYSVFSSKTKDSGYARPRNRTKSPFGGFGTPRKGRGKGSTTNLSRKKSMSSGNIFSVPRGNGRENRPMRHQKSVDNLCPGENSEGLIARFENEDRILSQTDYQDPVDAKHQAADSLDSSGRESRGRRRRVVSGSSFTINLRGSSKGRHGSNTNIGQGSNRSSSQPRRRPESRISLARRKQSSSRQDLVGFGSRHNLNKSDSRQDLYTGTQRGLKPGSMSSLNMRRADLSTSRTSLAGSRGRSRSRCNSNRLPRSQSARSLRGVGNNPPPGDCNIL